MSYSTIRTKEPEGTTLFVWVHQGLWSSTQQALEYVGLQSGW